MKKLFVYGTAVIALSAAPLFAQAGQSSTSQPPSGAGGGATDQQGSSGGRTGSPSGSQSGSQGGQSGSTGASTRSGSPSDAKANASADQHFVMEAAAAGMAEVELGRLAGEKASSDQVKQFGQRMVTDHTKANDELKTIAQGKSITLPTDMDSKHKATRDKLSKLSGAEFDRAYMQEMLADHRKNVNDFRKESQSGKDPEVKAWAAKNLPALEEHLAMAQSSRGAVGTSGKSGASDKSGASGSGATGAGAGSHGGSGSTGGATGTGGTGTTGGATGSGGTGSTGTTPGRP